MGRPKFYGKYPSQNMKPYYHTEQHYGNRSSSVTMPLLTIEIFCLSRCFDTSYGGFDDSCTPLITPLLSTHYPPMINEEAREVRLFWVS